MFVFRSLTEVEIDGVGSYRLRNQWGAGGQLRRGLEGGGTPGLAAGGSVNQALRATVGLVMNGRIHDSCGFSGLGASRRQLKL